MSTYRSINPNLHVPCFVSVKGCRGSRDAYGWTNIEVNLAVQAKHEQAHGIPGMFSESWRASF